MNAFLVTYSENNSIKFLRIECADLETCKKAFNQFRVKTNYKIVTMAIEDLSK